jgi:hypothetical protein
MCGGNSTKRNGDSVHESPSKPTGVTTPGKHRKYQREFNIQQACTGQQTSAGGQTTIGSFLTRGINAAIARARHQAHSLEAIAAALRHKQGDPAEVLQWLKDEGLDQLVAAHTRGPL